MFKLLVLICAAILLINGGVFTREKEAKQLAPFFYDAKGEYAVCIGEGGSLSEINTFSTEEMEKFYDFENVTAQSVRVYDLDYIDVIIKRYGFEKVFEEKVENISVCYYYSDKIPVYKSINGKKINLQTALGNQIYTIGTPMIYGSF